MSLADIAESWLAAHFDDLVEWRRHIHRYPELGRQEYATTQFVAALANQYILPAATPHPKPLTRGANLRRKSTPTSLEQAHNQA